MSVRVLAVILIGVGGVLLPAAPASAVCMPAYQAVTGDCSPCHTIQRVKPSTICLQ